ncbi:CoA transferase [Actinotalea sp. M2MS4P-6]|uniref:CoA transferase n=1 Tax=Actinotalea sp. M2MS4P-6 TaxID=2983762 RepID=UPI0021E3BE4C|nr:CoA transferase [Actinotalea sp. M2MS4P-6]MCV2394286.1 CoA transferase [Actinotalea sp. M2MS4P-6]
MTTTRPDFGLLPDLRVVMIGQSVAAPFAGQLYAEHGADVIWIENPKAIDSSRVARRSGAWQQDRRNMRSLSMNYLEPDGREVFLRLMETTDVLVEASVGGRFRSLGLSDEVLWERNPRLVIAHISGFGQTGDPAYVSRASYDPIAQAFGCAMRMNGVPGLPSMPAMPFPADYAAAMYAFGMANAALVRRGTTGRGESIDIAQFELMMRMQANYPTDYLRYGLDYVREGSHSRICAVYGTYACADGEEVYLLVLGAGVVRRTLAVLGLEYGSELFPEGATFVPVDTPAAEVLETRFAEWIATRTAAQVEEELASAGVPCSRLMDYEAARTHPHYVARGVLTEWTAADGATPIPGVKVVPEVAGRPGQVWRGAPTVGMDNDDVLAELGVADDVRDRMYAAGHLTRRDYEETTGA